MQNKGRNKIKKFFNASEKIKKFFSLSFVKPSFKKIRRGRGLASFSHLNKNRFLLRYRYKNCRKKRGKFFYFLNMKKLKNKKRRKILRKLKRKKFLRFSFLKSQQYSYKLLKSEIDLKFTPLTGELTTISPNIFSNKKSFFIAKKKRRKIKKRIFKKNILFLFLKSIYKKITLNRGFIAKNTNGRELLFYYLLFYFKKYNLSFYFLIL